MENHAKNNNKSRAMRGFYYRAPFIKR